MARDKTRGLQWEKGRRAVSNTSMSSPSPTDGSEGDIQVRQTSVGSRLFAKSGGRWLSVALEEDITPRIELQTYYDVKLMAAEAEVTVGDPPETSYGIRFYLPSTFRSSHIIGIVSLVQGGGASWQVLNWADAANDSAETKYRVLYWDDDHSVTIDKMGTQTDDGKWCKIIVFYVKN